MKSMIVCFVLFFTTICHGEEQKNPADILGQVIVELETTHKMYRDAASYSRVPTDIGFPYQRVLTKLESMRLAVLRHMRKSKISGQISKRGADFLNTETDIFTSPSETLRLRNVLNQVKKLKRFSTSEKNTLIKTVERRVFNYEAFQTDLESIITLTQSAITDGMATILPRKAGES